jgi:uncharacterized protein YndB with AHSA1/START domain
METTSKTIITIESNVNAPLEKVWEYFTSPEHITKWNFASDDWHSPTAKNDLRTGGHFVYRMEAKDGSMGFDFGGVYDAITEYSLIDATLGDGRKLAIYFAADGEKTIVTESFEAEEMNSIELQRTGWQMILDNFKKYTETH